MSSIILRPPLSERARASSRAILLSFLAVVLAPGLNAQEVMRPQNIVFIYADDLGYGDAGCYGATAIPTPNIDRLAREGLRFLDAHSEAATCTPSRYSLMTGKYAFRKKGTDILPGDANLIIPPGEPNLAAMLKGAGYTTGMIGKWHLGLGEGKIDWNERIGPGPQELGFDYAFMIPATLDRVPCVYLDKGSVVALDQNDPLSVNYKFRIGDDPTGFSNPGLARLLGDPQHSGTIVNGVPRIGFMKGGHSARWVDETMPEILSDKAVAFIEENKAKPFFLYYAMTEPHVPRLPNPRFVGATHLGPRGDVIVQLDWEVGKILGALDKLGLSQDTLVIFSSDNGPVFFDGYKDKSKQTNGDHKPAGPFRGGKYDAFEGGTRMPFIVRWPNYVKPGESKALISQMDLLATLAALTKQALPDAAGLDSLNMLPAFLGQSPNGRESLLEQGTNAMGLRAGNWKLIKRNNKAGAANTRGAQALPLSLYNLEADPGEKKNLAGSEPAKTAEMLEKLQKAMGHQQFVTGEEDAD